MTNPELNNWNPQIILELLSHQRMSTYLKACNEEIDD